MFVTMGSSNPADRDADNPGAPDPAPRTLRDIIEHRRRSPALHRRFNELPAAFRKSRTVDDDDPLGYRNLSDLTRTVLGDRPIAHSTISYWIAGRRGIDLDRLDVAAACWSAEDYPEQQLRRDMRAAIDAPDHPSGSQMAQVSPDDPAFRKRWDRLYPSERSAMLHFMSVLIRAHGKGDPDTDDLDDVLGDDLNVDDLGDYTGEQSGHNGNGSSGNVTSQD